MKKINIIVLLALCLLQTACGHTENNGTETTGQPVQSSDAFCSEKDLQTEYTDPITIRLAGDGSTADGDGVFIEGNTISILEGGTYLLSGTLTDGMILVDVPDADVWLVLANADITNSAGAALYVREDISIKLQ